MDEPKKVCRDVNLYSYQSYKGAEAMADKIKEDVLRILTTPSEKTIYQQLKDYFQL